MNKNVKMRKLFKDRRFKRSFYLQHLEVLREINDSFDRVEDNQGGGGPAGNGNEGQPTSYESRLRFLSPRIESG